MSNRSPPTPHASHIDLLKFVGMEHTNFMVSMTRLHQEFAAFGHIDDLYVAAIPIESRVPEEHVVSMNLLIFCHYQLYQTIATLFRCHLSDAFGSLRVSIEAALHVHRFLEGRGTPQEYVQREDSFRYTVNHFRKALKDKPDAFPLAASLIGMHELCSKYGSHADVNSFLHRIVFVPGDESAMNQLYFQKPDRDADFQFYTVTILHTFLVILNVFEPLLVSQLRFVDSTWSADLRKTGSMLEDWRRQLKEPKAAT